MEHAERRARWKALERPPFAGRAGWSFYRNGCAACYPAKVRHSSQCFRRRPGDDPNFASDGGGVIESELVTKIGFRQDAPPDGTGEALNTAFFTI